MTRDVHGVRARFEAGDIIIEVAPADVVVVTEIVGDEVVRTIRIKSKRVQARVTPAEGVPIGRLKK